MPFSASSENLVSSGDAWRTSSVSASAVACCRKEGYEAKHLLVTDVGWKFLHSSRVRGALRIAEEGEMALRKERERRRPDWAGRSIAAQSKIKEVLKTLLQLEEVDCESNWKPSERRGN